MKEKSKLMQRFEEALKSPKLIVPEYDLYCSNDYCRKLIISKPPKAFFFKMKEIPESYTKGFGVKCRHLTLCKKCAKKFIDLLDKNNFKFSNNDWDWFE